MHFNEDNSLKLNDLYFNKKKQYHNMDLISAVEDKFTINNKALEYKDINTIYGTSMKKWSEYYTSRR